MPFTMPDGWPISLWFFVATAIVYLLQRFPYTGIFLMILGAMLWSVVLINLGFIGIGVEAITGRVSRAWLILPLLYFGTYYLAYYKDQAALAALRKSFVEHNAGKSLPFDQARQDLLFEKGKGDFHPSPFEFVRRFGVKRTYSSDGRVHFMGNSEACALLRGNDVFRSAGIHSSGFYTDERVGRRRPTGFCSIYAPGKPELPTVRVRSDERTEKEGLAVRKQEVRIRDEASQAEVELWAGSASPLRAFPMPAMGCALNSGAPSWDCFAGFMRKTESLLTPGQRYSNTTAAIAEVLGLEASEDYDAVATSPEWLREIGEEADRKLVAEEVARLEKMLADPEAKVDGWFRHLPNRPDAILPYGDRIFATLGTLHTSGKRLSPGTGNGRELWNLAAYLPDEVLDRHREEMIEWLSPETAKEFSKSADRIYTRLNAAEPRQREIMLRRLEEPLGDLRSSLLPQFCRMGAAAPDDVKRRLLAIWQARGRRAAERKSHRDANETILYATLLRMGLKEQAGKVEQRYYGPTFEGIWNEVTPDTAADICDGNLNDLSNRYRRR